MQFMRTVQEELGNQLDCNAAEQAGGRDERAHLAAAGGCRGDLPERGLLRRGCRGAGADVPKAWLLDTWQVQAAPPPNPMGGLSGEPMWV